MRILVDDKCYTSKPSNAGIVTNSIVNHPVDITIEKLAEEIVKGKSFTLSDFHTVDGKISRSQEYWKSQQLICLDFDNEIVKKINGKRVKVKCITKTWEQAKEEFKETAAFMYKTFNYTDNHHKFRVVFMLDEVVINDKLMDGILEEYKDRYPDADPKCFERARLLYGGTEIYVFDYNNRINVNTYIDKLNIHNTYSQSVDQGVLGVQYSLDKYFNAIVTPKPPPKLISVEKNLSLIRTKNVKRLHEILNPQPIKFYTYSETVEYIKKQDIGLLLGIDTPSNFRCIFHEDNNPSASIFKNADTGDYIYCCQSSNCTFGTGMVIKCIERILKCNRIQSLKFLRELYKVEFHQTEWQKEQIEYLDENIRYLQSPDFPQEYPIQYGLIKNYLDDLVKFISISKDYIPAEHYSIEHANVLFFMSLRHFAKICGKSNISRVGDRIALFTYLKYIYKLDEHEIPVRLLERAKKELVMNKNKNSISSMNLINFYSIHPYSEETLSETENKAKEFRGNHFTMKGISKEMFIRALGEEEANRIYPQMKEKKVSEKSHRITKELEQAALQLIDEKGWTTESEILKLIDGIVEGSKDSKQRQMKKIIGELCIKYGIERKRANKILLTELGIGKIYNDEGIECYPFLLIKVDNL
ncbi:hypothetical protein [Paenibacillus naphthalenovorans]|uniref:Uncharacterized protein n=1 Tax=Paenibacillus naphthalenovorans TaxID=162209 RepID=A0A0U2W4D9_9BACL|nr:hypothetical protein [Paenibacillus naphthalenovorans]ALS22285.1 hypothetical protein IJ22_19110 [Paenibacillus naphthalenovorans]